ncbi:MAG: hypothetical protein JXQ29_04255, partial [Planctomycetes bacterium]|nr:hypothetical protein [Planctomycetota bacterium]
PDEDDIREFRQRRRREVTRRGFIVAGVAAALGALALPFLPGKKRALDPKMLFELDPASADKRLLKDLCITFFRHPNPEIRFQCARVMAALPGDQQIKDGLWLYIRSDPETRVRDKAVESLIRHFDSADLSQLAAEYHANPALREVIDRTVERMDYEPLRTAINHGYRH